jgi:23S rRNA (adenine2503-C2)-methyltransferase
MGMGEPLDNWQEVRTAITTLTAKAGYGMSPRRITLSTVGHAAGLAEFVTSSLQVGLTLSVCGVSTALRRKLTPVAARIPLSTLLDQVEHYARGIRRPATLAYVLIAGLTDDLDQARQLTTRVGGRPFKINLIPLNALDDDSLQAPPLQQVQQFQELLRAAGLRTYIRISGGRDIAAACGQLRQRRQEEIR